MPVQASFTLGNYTNTYPYHVNDFDPHVSGVIGYVWPGGGELASPTPNLGYVNSIPPGESPGYQSPWSTNPPGAPSYTWYQLSGNAYSPFGAILTGSTGDLVFAVNASTFASDGDGGPWTKPDTTHTSWGWGSLSILIPPEFGNIKPEQVVSTITNDYGDIAVATLSQNDRYAPGWTLIQIYTEDSGWNHAGAIYSSYSTSPAQFVSGVSGWLFNSTDAHEWYYVRINGVTAPTVAGKYFFKMELGGSPSVNGAGDQPDYWVPPQNWPVLLVKGEIDPAIIWGNIYYGGYNTTLYGTGVEEAGMVTAVMTAKLDPYTGAVVPGGTLTNAVGYFNATAQGHYEVEGVAAGQYDVYASAAGFPEQLIASNITVLKGQSLNLNGYLNPGVVIHGTVYSKHGFGEQPWTVPGENDPTASDWLGEPTPGSANPSGIADSYIKIEIYNQPTVGSKVANASALVSWSPLPCIAGANGAYMGAYTTDDASECGTAYGSTVTAFPWHEYGTWTTVASSSSLWTGYNTLIYNTNVDEQGVGPAQSWSVPGPWNTAPQDTNPLDPFYYQFGVKGEYGAPSEMSGMVPQLAATWVNGLTPGRYYMRAWVAGYVQTAIDGATFIEYPIDVSANEWAGDISVPIDLHLSSFIVKTVHFHDTAGTLTDQPVSTTALFSDNNYITGELVDESSPAVNWAWATQPLDATAYPTTSYCSGGICSKSGTGQGYDTLYLYGYVWRWDGEDYGIPAGTYTPQVYVLGYVEQTFP